MNLSEEIKALIELYITDQNDAESFYRTLREAISVCLLNAYNRGYEDGKKA